ncbi:EB1 domain-containing protein [Coprinopsis cinerea okayama7|uniref:EB1 domain-containing protein n=1 Tax=Coprinopsis cinerea (strain Okayama-7 / 130 / ATCC MYA-4618 / FGSC 9003) TaxID=240176 RepID=A8PEN2_COPC7|nr:EB1 domain-containing protein [Coprinopsis cinerea okayama7\|eukprot:XP_001840807.1 EB1 domain-containing protein [Coprinopsis cinerea okayama7\
MTASRTDLLAWLNELLQINYTKIEQCGSGGAYCQIMDSIYGDVPMNRVKMNAKHEYEFLVNYKVLQTFFKNKKIDKPIPVEKLTKCKMQDNLEFLQWMKRFWDANYGGQGYDAVARRKGVPLEPPATVAPVPTSRSTGAGLAAGGARAGGRTPLGGFRSGSAQSQETIVHLQNQVSELTGQLEGLEKERDFYFEKLREIEILVQEQLDLPKEEQGDQEVFTRIQKILYSTEDGFEVPDPQAAVDEEETF